MERSYNQNGHLVIKGLSVYLQMISIALIIIFGVMYLFIPEIVLLLELSVVLFLFLSAYNNEKLFKRKYMTVVYTIVGVLYLIGILIETFGR